MKIEILSWHTLSIAAHYPCRSFIIIWNTLFVHKLKLAQHSLSHQREFCCVSGTPYGSNNNNSSSLDGHLVQHVFQSVEVTPLMSQASGTCPWISDLNELTTHLALNPHTRAHQRDDLPSAAVSYTTAPNAPHLWEWEAATFLPKEVLFIHIIRCFLQSIDRWSSCRGSILPDRDAV